jgi:hypothetical protein
MSISGTPIYTKSEMVSGKLFGRMPPWSKSESMNVGGAAKVDEARFFSLADRMRASYFGAVN